jgi:hypothetical protein
LKGLPFPAGVGLLTIGSDRFGDRCVEPDRVSWPHPLWSIRVPISTLFVASWNKHWLLFKKWFGIVTRH